MKARQTESIGMVSRLAGAGMLFALAAVLTPCVVRAEKANVFFIHGANVSENDARAWAAENWGDRYRIKHQDLVQPQGQRHKPGGLQSVVTADGKCRTAFYSLPPHTLKRVATTRFRVRREKKMRGLFRPPLWYNIRQPFQEGAFEHDRHQEAEG